MLMPSSDDALSRPAPAGQNGLPPGLRLRATVGVVMAVALATLDTAIANTALPTIAAELGIGPGTSVWVVTIYQLALVATLLP